MGVRGYGGRPYVNLSGGLMGALCSHDDEVREEPMSGCNRMGKSVVGL